MKKILAILAFLSFFIIAAVWQQCIPGFCSDDPGFCSGSDLCVSETVAQHFSERMAMFNFTAPAQSAGVFFVFLVLAALLKHVLSVRRIFDDLILIRLKIGNYKSVRLHNYLFSIFSGGILNPKKYILVN